MEQKIRDKIRLYSEIYIECLEISIKGNPNNSRYMANEMFREVAKDMRSELISRLQNGLHWGNIEAKDDKDNGSTLANDPKEGRLATDKQRAALRKFGLEKLPGSLGIKEAGEILNILVCHSREGDHDAIADLVGKFNKEWAENPTTVP